MILAIITIIIIDLKFNLKNGRITFRDILSPDPVSP